MYRWTVNKNLGILNRLSEVNKIGQCNFKIENKICYINNLFVEKENRNQNLGSELLKEIEKYSKHRNLNEIRLVIHQEYMDTLENFYTKNGYKKCEITKDDIYDDGEKIFEIKTFKKNI
jgi:GNAT superfamily N-acetyltransferase